MAETVLRVVEQEAVVAAYPKVFVGGSGQTVEVGLGGSRRVGQHLGERGRTLVETVEAVVPCAGIDVAVGTFVHEREVRFQNRPTHCHGLEHILLPVESQDRHAHIARGDPHLIILVHHDATDVSTGIVLQVPR
jgi:hypothetical protein